MRTAKVIKCCNQYPKFDIERQTVLPVSGIHHALSIICRSVVTKTRL